MKSINFNTGIKRYAVNGDENNVVAINVSDLNMLKRIKDAETVFDPILARLDTEENTPELMFEIDKEIKEKLDYIFGTDISSHVFGGANCLSPLEDGGLLFMSFFEAFAPMVIEDINKSRENFAANKTERFEKYLPGAEKPKPAKKANLKDLQLTDAQLAYLESLG